MKNFKHSFSILAFYFIFNLGVSQAQIINGLQAYYPLNGNANDYSGNGNHGTLQNTPSVASDKYGGTTHAYAFDPGSSEYIRCGDILDNLFSPPSSAAQFTITGWAKSDSWASVQGGNIIVGKSPGGLGSTYQWLINHDDDGKIKGVVCTDGSSAEFVERESGTVSTGVWFHFALIFDGSQANDNDKVQLYIDAVAGSVSRTGINPLGNKTVNTNQEITIGGGHDQGNPASPNNLYDGTIDDIRIYDRVLTHDEVKTLADFDLVVYYPFDMDANNYSGIGGYHCTPQNSPIHDTDRLGDSLWAYEFDPGSSQYLRCGDILDSIFSPSSDTAQFTVTGWAKSNSWAPFQGGNVIIGKVPGGNGTSYQWFINHDNDGRIKGVICSTGNCSDYIELKSAVVGTSQWFQFALVFDGYQSTPSDRIKLYVDGVAGTSSRSNGTLGTKTANTNQEITVASGHNQNSPGTPNNLYDGHVDEIRIFSKPLTLDQAYILRKSIPTGLNSVKSNNSGVFPNPSQSGIFTISNGNRSVFEVRSITGCSIMSGNINAENYKLDLTGYSKGVYLLSIKSGSHTDIVKLVIQ